MITCELLEKKIKSGLKESRVSITNPSGDQEHFFAVVEHKAFKGKTLIEQHRMVYASLGNLFKGKLHSLALKTKIKDD